MNEADHVTVSRDALDALARLDAGDYRPALERMNREPSTDSDPASQLWRAELLLYLDRLDDVHETIAPLEAALAPHLSEASPLGACARRRQLLAAEVAYFRGNYDLATELANSCALAAEAVSDAHTAMRATYDAGRILRRRGEYATSLETLLIASHMARRIESVFYEGMVAYNRAICCYELGDYDRLSEYLDTALDRLAASERLRFLALCQNLYGLILTETGEIDSGMRVFDEAERMASELGIISDLLSIANNAARALIAGQKYEEAERRLESVVERDSGTDHPFEAFYSLCLLSIAQVAQSKVREARRRAQQALALAESSGSEEDRFEAGLLSLRARALGGEEAAIDELRDALRRADDQGTEAHRAQARIYLSQALVAESPVEATSLCREVRASGIVPPGSWLYAELERVEYLLAHAPISIDEHDRLIIDTRLSWPTIKSAREAAERFIYDRAMSSTRGNASAAGRLIGESRYQMHHLGRILRGEAPRPSRSKDPGASAKKPVRRRSRIQFS